MTLASRFLRNVELALWAVGISMFGVALGATYDRWSYQQQQERALFYSAPTQASAAESPLTPQRTAAFETPGPIGPVALETSGPARPALVDRSLKNPPPAVAEKSAVERAEKKVDAALDPSVFGRIEIPRLGVTAIVREGADEGTLARAVGLIPGAAHPGQSGNTVLAGHRDTFFRPLRKIRVNDRIRLRVPGDVYEYRVAETRVVSPEETDVLQSRGYEELTLVTCYPFRFIGPAPERFIVKATRVD